MVFAKAGLDQLFSAAARYQSFVVGRDRSAIGFTVSLKLRSFMCIVMGADTATNAPPSQIPGRWQQF